MDVFSVSPHVSNYGSRLKDKKMSEGSAIFYVLCVIWIIVAMYQEIPE